MNSIENIFSLTNQGKDLIIECYPQFLGVDDGKMVKLRPEEKVASAHIHKHGDKYYLKDFGSGDKAMDGIDVFATCNGMDRSDAIRHLALRYGIYSGNTNVLGPKYERRALTGELKTGEKRYEFRSDFLPEELRFLAPCATAETVKSLGWESVSRIIICKEDCELIVNSTPAYPIFARRLRGEEFEGKNAMKIYQPRNVARADGRSYKFSYYPSGLNSGNYVHGLYELEQCVKDGEKVDAVVICSGERDAIVVKSFDMHPVWLNSETKEIRDHLIHHLGQLAKAIYYIPDIDKTGKCMALQNMKRHGELRTVWLPESITARTGDQNKPCKDLRDWAEIHRTRSEFYALINTAKTYQFWHMENGKPVFDADSMLYFLNKNGFWRIHDENSNYQFVHINGHRVKAVTIEDIRHFITDWTQKQDKSVRNMMLANRKNKIDLINDLPVKEVDFKNSTSKSQIFAFQNKQIIVTAEDIKEVDEDSQVFFWDNKIIKHDFTFMPQMFSYVPYEDSNGKTQFQITNLNPSCKLLCILANSSRIYWFAEEHGIELTESQQQEENLNLSARLFSIGYLLHRHKEKAREWAPLYMDNNTNPNSNAAEGGTLKSFIVSDILPKCGLEVVKYAAKKRNAMEDDFIFDEVTKDTDVVFIDECPDGFEYDKFNTSITNDLTINKKNHNRYTLPYEQSPKFALASNWVPHDDGGSFFRRYMCLTNSDYYHYASPNNGYTTSRSPRDEYGMVIMGDDYPEEDWVRDYNFLLQCEQFYLHAVSELNDKITPNLSSILQRAASKKFPSEFGMWADKFYTNPDNLNKPIVLSLLVEKYNQENHIKLDSRKVKTYLKSWATYKLLEFNPLDVCNDKQYRRIKNKVCGRSVESVYIRGILEED